VAYSAIDSWPEEKRVDSRIDTASHVHCLPCRSLLDLCSRTRHEWLSKSSLNVVHRNTLDDLLEKIENSNGQEEDAKKYWQELERLQAMPPVMFLTHA